jgi:hypothetical protein
MGFTLLGADKWTKIGPEFQSLLKSKTPVSEISVVTYNVWFEDHYMDERITVLSHMLG